MENSIPLSVVYLAWANCHSTCQIRIDWKVKAAMPSNEGLMSDEGDTDSTDTVSACPGWSGCQLHFSTDPDPSGSTGRLYV